MLVLADTFTASSGNWNTGTNWVRTNAGLFVSNSTAPTGTNPAAGDTILVPAGVTMNIQGGGNKTSITPAVVVNLYGTINFSVSSATLTLVSTSSIIQIAEGADIATPASGSSETLTIGSGSNKASIMGSTLNNLQAPNQVTFNTLDNSPPGGCAENGGCDEDPLPVELLFFSVFVNNDQNIDLSWATATEQNFEYFEIAHSLNGKDFDIIGTVAGHGNTTTRHDYNFVHSAPYHGLNYYRLKSVDYDGYTEIFPLVAVQLNQQLRPQVFPNPSDGYLLQFKGSDALNPFDVEIISLDGKQHILRQGVLGNSIIMSPSLSQGLYIVNIIVGQQSFTQRLIVR